MGGSNSSKIDQVSQHIAIRDPDLKKMFRTCLKSIWENALTRHSDGTVYVSSEDKRCMTLSESTGLMIPYCYLCRDSAELKVIIRGVIDSQIRMILTDPYANSFQMTRAENHPLIFERLFTLDSLISPLQLIWSYWQSSGDDSIFDETMLSALRMIHETLAIEQDHDERSEYHCQPDEGSTVDKNRQNIERPVGFTGMIWSGYRPGGERCHYNYHLPSQMLVVAGLYSLIEIYRDIYADQDSAESIMDLQDQINRGIREFGRMDHPVYGDLYVYETDGLGNQIVMDEACYPNLLSIPHFGYAPVEDEIYQNTRRFILSRENPNFVQGKSLSGLGINRAGKSWISSQSLIMTALTTDNPLDREELFELIKKSHAGTYQMQERLDADDLSKIISRNSDRANAMLLELILTKLSGLY